MAIFPVLEIEDLVQASDKTRLDARKSYVSTADTAITKIEIKPSASDSYVDVTTAGYLDWQYTQSAPDATTGKETKVVSLKVTNAGGDQTITKNLITISEAKDNLFSTDDQLRKHEFDILKYIPTGRATFKDVHRRAQSLIFAYLDTHGYTDYFNDKLDKADITDITEVSEWSAMVALRLIMEAVMTNPDDIYGQKAKKYQVLEDFYRNRAILRIDLDRDGQTIAGEGLGIRSAFVVRR